MRRQRDLWKVLGELNMQRNALGHRLGQQRSDLLPPLVDARMIGGRLSILRCPAP